MVYNEYYNAAKRHRATCNHLLANLTDPKNLIDTHLKTKLLQNSYYLSGYIIECIVSYAFFKVIAYDKSKSVYQLDNNNPYGYTFHGFFKEHSSKFNDRRIQIISEKGGNIPSETPIIGTGAKKEIENDMYKAWDAKIRYSVDHLGFKLDQNNVKRFFETSTIIYTKLAKL